MRHRPLVREYPKRPRPRILCVVKPCGICAARRCCSPQLSCTHTHTHRKGHEDTLEPHRLKTSPFCHIPIPATPPLTDTAGTTRRRAEPRWPASHRPGPPPRASHPGRSTAARDFRYFLIACQIRAWQMGRRHVRRGNNPARLSRALAGPGVVEG